METDDMDAIRARLLEEHRKAFDGGCWKCDKPWPCDIRILLVENERLNRHLDVADSTLYCDGQEVARLTVEVERLRSRHDCGVECGEPCLADPQCLTCYTATEMARLTAEVGRLHIITAWYEEKHTQRRAQVYAEMKRAEQAEAALATRDMEWTRTLGIGGDTPVTPEWARESFAMHNREMVQALAFANEKIQALRPAAPPEARPHNCQPGNYPDCCDPTPESKPLPLGHPFRKPGCFDYMHSTQCSYITDSEATLLGGDSGRCGQPESAHTRRG